MAFLRYKVTGHKYKIRKQVVIEHKRDEVSSKFLKIHESLSHLELSYIVINPRSQHRTTNTQKTNRAVDCKKITETR